MFFKKDDQSELDNLVKCAEADRKKLAALEQEFRGLEPEWERIQEEAERLRAQYNAMDDTYDRAVSEVLWAERTPKLKARIAALVIERDALTAPVVAEIAELKAKIDRRHSIVTGAFGNWSNAVAPVLPAPLAGELQAARKRCEASQDLSEIISEANRWVEKAVEAAENSVVPLVNWTKVVQQLSSEGHA